jgi:hypothetical protein
VLLLASLPHEVWLPSLRGLVLLVLGSGGVWLCPVSKRQAAKLSPVSEGLRLHAFFPPPSAESLGSLHDLDPEFLGLRDYSGEEAQRETMTGSGLEPSALTLKHLCSKPGFWEGSTVKILSLEV